MAATVACMVTNRFHARKHLRRMRVLPMRTAIRRATATWPKNCHHLRYLIKVRFTKYSAARFWLMFRRILSWLRLRQWWKMKCFSFPGG